VTLKELKTKSYIIIEYVQKKVLKIQHHFVIKNSQLGIEGMHLNTIQVMYEKPTDKTVLNGENLKGFPLKS
jgi:hypothetical protein